MNARPATAVGGLLLAALPAVPLAADCSEPLAIDPIPQMRVHVGFPVDESARVNRICGTIQWRVVYGPPEFRIDGAGGLFYWTPACAGTETITISATETASGVPSTATRTFTAIVDENTMTVPHFRDYLSDIAPVTIQGRASGAGFVWYALDFADAASPDVRIPIAGPISTPVPSTGPLGSWDISALPDGGRYVLRLTVH